MPMRIHRLHDWNLTPASAVQLQRELAGRIDARTPLRRFELVAGADVSYNRYSPTMFAAVVVYRIADGAVVETQEAICDTPFPYVPGLLSFREAPAVLAAFAKLRTEPHVVMIDGQGYAHPRRIGLACHVGLFLDLPTFGCAKSLLIGRYGKLGRMAGALSPLLDGQEQIGYAVRTRFDTRPVFVSVGHRIDLASALRVVAATSRGRRIPEPTRQAHLRVNEIRRCTT